MARPVPARRARRRRTPGAGPAACNRQGGRASRRDTVGRSLLLCREHVIPESRPTLGGCPAPRHPSPFREIPCTTVDHALGSTIGHWPCTALPLVPFFPHSLCFGDIHSRPQPLVCLGGRAGPTVHRAAFYCPLPPPGGRGHPAPAGAAASSPDTWGAESDDQRGVQRPARGPAAPCHAPWAGRPHPRRLRRGWAHRAASGGGGGRLAEGPPPAAGGHRCLRPDAAHLPADLPPPDRGGGRPTGEGGLSAGCQGHTAATTLPALAADARSPGGGGACRRTALRDRHPRGSCGRATRVVRGFDL